MKAGNIVYTNKVRTGHKTYLEYSLKGHAICLLLGIVDKKTPPPTEKQVRQLMGEIGLCSFDDIEDCLGVKTSEKVMKFFEEKYK